MKKEHQVIAIEAAVKAGDAIMEVYSKADTERGIEQKSDDSPLTLADRNAHQVIAKALKNTGIPTLSEEGRDIEFKERSEWKQFWMVDPLDGTKEFIKRNGEFTVNIALIEDGVPIWGVVYAPVLNQLFSVDENENGYLKVDDNLTYLPKLEIPFDENKSDLNVVASRSHLNNETQEFLDNLDEPNIVSMGSSLKFMMLAQGKADVYPRFAPTMEWDTAAAHAVLRSIGRDVYQMNGERLEYNKEDLLNPWFIAK